MTRYGLFIDYEYCSGCKVCVTACKMEHGFEPNDFGIVLLQDGPRECSDGKWEYNYLPMPTSLCNLCESRTEEGKPPSCVMHCPAHCMYFGEIEELSKTVAEKTHRVLFTPYGA